MTVTARHFGIVVQNLNQSLKLYNKILGLKIWKRNVEKGSYIDNVIGLKNTVLEWIKLKDKNGFIIELIKYHRPALKNNSKAIPVNQIGCLHIAVTVSNIKSMYKKLINNGYYCNSVPQVSPDGKAKVLYCRDKDGVIMELVEEL